MKKFILALFAAIVSIGAMAQCSDSLTAKDYSNAEQFLFYNTNKFIDHGRVDPQWISDDRFWYSDSKADGNDYVLVNAATGKKSVVSREDLPKEEHSRPKRNEVLSPDGTKAAFIKDYNLWVRDIPSGKETELQNSLPHPLNKMFVRKLN